MDALREAAEALANAKRAVALTGAGVSAESGIPTFRGRDGLWRRYRPEELATPQAFARDPRQVWEFYQWRQRLIASASPNPAHYALAELERLGVLEAIITQNVDGLHQRAGSRRVVELHGNIWRIRCVSCGYEEALSEPVEQIPPRCPVCGGLMRPGVVWFGEPLPRDAWEEAVELARTSDVMLVVGTSGVVYPAALLPAIARDAGATVIEVNVEDTAITPIAHIVLRGRAGEVLPRLAELVKQLIRKR